MVSFTRIIAIALCFQASAAGAEPVEDWGEAGRWKIRVDRGTGSGCFMETGLDDGSIVRFGLVPNRNGGFFAIYNSSWTDIVVGDEANVTLEFDAKQFTGDAAGVEQEGVPGGYAYFNNPNVRDEFSRSNIMMIYDDKGHTIKLDLSGTSKAAQAVEACQKQQTE